MILLVMQDALLAFAFIGFDPVFAGGPGSSFNRTSVFSQIVVAAKTHLSGFWLTAPLLATRNRPAQLNFALTRAR
jgi:hypothetical protein